MVLVVGSVVVFNRVGKVTETVVGITFVVIFLVAGVFAVVIVIGVVVVVVAVVFVIGVVAVIFVVLVVDTAAVVVAIDLVVVVVVSPEESKLLFATAIKSFNTSSTKITSSVLTRLPFKINSVIINEANKVSQFRWQYETI